MEKDIKLGEFGDLDIKLDKGKITIAAQGAVTGAALSIQAGVVMDVGVLVDKLEALVEEKYPLGMPIEKAVFAVLKSGLLSV